MRAGPPRFRLARTVRPTAYDLHLRLDLPAGRFAGEVAIRVRLVRRTRAVTLHASDLVVDAAGARVGAAERPATVRARPAAETIALVFAEALPAGEAVLHLRYRGAIGANLRGLYGVTAGGARFAFTHCQPTDARRILPCFDEPGFKARFAVTVTAGAGDAIVANGPAEHERRDAGGRTVCFAATPPLSTYLFALAAGPLEASAVQTAGATPVRLWHVPGKARLTAFGLEAAVESLRRLEDYFGTPYPYAKLDLIAVPDFEAGAMENAGAVFFREALLLVDPRTASLEEQKRAAEVIAHELAHMWFGNLVTLRWWDDLWLNEAFATWMAGRIVAAWRPEWRIEQGAEHGRALALAWDALASTHPIYTPVGSAAEALQNFDPITYLKGAAVVAMLERHVGAPAFRDGLRRYLERHREANATAADLWRALEEASGRPVATVARAWIETAGFPLVRLDAPRDRRRVVVRQERFFADRRVARARRRKTWPLPLDLKVPGAAAVGRLVDRPRATVTLDGGPAWCFGNRAAAGFYRVRHDAAARAALLADPYRALTPVERLAFVGDEWAIAHAGQASVEGFLAVADALGDETDHDVLEGLVAPLAWLDQHVAAPGSATQRQLRGWVAARFGEPLARLGWGTTGDDVATRLRRAALVRLAGGVAEAPAVLAAARARIDGYLADPASLEPNLAETVVDLAARVGDEGLRARYRAVAADAADPLHRRRLLLGLASFRAPAAIAATLEATLTSEIPTQEVAAVLIRLLHAPAARAAAWRFIATRWDRLRDRLPPRMLGRLIEATPTLGTRYARDVARFLRANPLPEATRAVRQAVELLRVHADFQRRAAPALARWLRRRAGAVVAADLRSSPAA